MRKLETYANISDYLKDHKFDPSDDGSHFSNGKHVIPVEMLAKHTVKSFDEYMRKKGYVGDEKKEEKSIILDSYGRVFGLTTDMSIVDIRKSTLGIMDTQLEESLTFFGCPNPIQPWYNPSKKDQP